nr:uncharacterized protein LOC109153162 isoform X3 [Ipomoea batatas]GMC54116.1 uncharacterized protein LOC109153162 isoform X3 [Ipomoea batatas]GMC56883.1 uncharacterized protein LOC109153162 isoform X3 [Ipomoea batatas]GMD11033.1 uncharacterized protein LOC109153162 isoform X3 [Ipomoea batatas]GMD46630.1 uncharacterized protein LOC109153162 isoform X3 [Ipomoea batatas]
MKVMLYKLLLWCSNKLPGMRSTFSTIQYSLPQICNDLSQFPDTALDGVMEKRSKMESLINLKRPSLQIQYWMYLQLNHQIYNDILHIVEQTYGLFQLCQNLK